MDETKLIPEALQELREFLDEQGWEYCLIGGLAAGRWGEARFTHDIDVVVRSAFGDEEDFIKPLLKKFKKRIAAAAQFAKAVRTVLVMAGNGVGIDISLGPWHLRKRCFREPDPHELWPELSSEPLGLKTSS